MIVMKTLFSPRKIEPLISFLMSLLLGIAAGHSQSVPSGTNFFVYSDAGIPVPQCEIYTWNDPTCSAEFNGKFSDPTVPEGQECFITRGNSCPWAGWGVFKLNSINLKNFSQG